MSHSRGQTSLEYILLVGGILAAVVLVITIAQSAVINPSINQLASAGPQYFNLLENIMGGYVPPGSVCALSASPSSLPFGGGSSTINATYRGLAPSGGNVTIGCGNTATATATGCPSATNSTASCTATCTYVSSQTYAVSASMGSTTCTPATVTVASAPAATPTPTPPPVISGVSAAPTSGNATITWTTDTPADSQVKYGTTSGYYPASVSDPALVTPHSVLVDSLQPNTTYFVQVRSCNAYGCGQSNESNFTTSPLLVPPMGNNTDFNVSLSLLSPSSLASTPNSPTVFLTDFDVNSTLAAAGITFTDSPSNVTLAWTDFAMNNTPNSPGIGLTDSPLNITTAWTDFGTNSTPSAPSSGVTGP